MTPVDNTYLDMCIDRVVGMLREVSGTFNPPIVRVEKFVNPKPPVPIWWVYPAGPGTPDRLAVQLTRQSYAVGLRLILGLVGSNYDGRHEEKLWVIMPTVLNYFNQRRGLVYQPGQKIPRYLDVANVGIELISPYGVFSNDSHIGIEFALNLPFTVAFDPVLGNH